jgi:hypothetical protein
MRYFAKRQRTDGETRDPPGDPPHWWSQKLTPPDRPPSLVAPKANPPGPPSDYKSSIPGGETRSVSVSHPTLGGLTERVERVVDTLDTMLKGGVGPHPDPPDSSGSNGVDRVWPTPEVCSTPTPSLSSSLLRSAPLPLPIREWSGAGGLLQCPTLLQFVFFQTGARASSPTLTNRFVFLFSSLSSKTSNMPLSIQILSKPLSLALSFFLPGFIRSTLATG